MVETTQKIKVPVSNAFEQDRKLGLSSKKTIDQNLKETHGKGVTYKRISQASQAVANIHKKNSRLRTFYNKLAQVARYLGHTKESNKYSLKYPSNKPYAQQVGKEREKG